MCRRVGDGCGLVCLRLQPGCLRLQPLSYTAAAPVTYGHGWRASRWPARRVRVRAARAAAAAAHRQRGRQRRGGGGGGGGGGGRHGGGRWPSARRVASTTAAAAAVEAPPPPPRPTATALYVIDRHRALHVLPLGALAAAGEGVAGADGGAAAVRVLGVVARQAPCTAPASRRCCRAPHMRWPYSRPRPRRPACPGQAVLAEPDVWLPGLVSTPYAQGASGDRVL